MTLPAAAHVDVPRSLAFVHVEERRAIHRWCTVGASTRIMREARAFVSFCRRIDLASISTTVIVTASGKTFTSLSSRLTFHVPV